MTHDLTDERVLAWLTVAEHPFVADCYRAEGTLLDAVLAKLDAAHTHTCEPVWRPVTFEPELGVSASQRDAVLLSELRTACANGRVRQIRTEASLSTSDVARVAGVLPSVITRWELGERRPRAGAPAVAYARLLARLNGGAL